MPTLLYESRSFGLLGVWYAHFIKRRNAISELDPEGVGLSPDDPALTGLGISSYMQSELIPNICDGYVGDFCSAIRKVFHSAMIARIALAVVNRSRRVPLDSKILSTLT
jgi:hypothetical protein